MYKSGAERKKGNDDDLYIKKRTTIINQLDRVNILICAYLFKKVHCRSRSLYHSTFSVVPPHLDVGVLVRQTGLPVGPGRQRVWLPPVRLEADAVSRLARPLDGDALAVQFRYLDYL